MDKNDHRIQQLKNFSTLKLDIQSRIKQEKDEEKIKYLAKLLADCDFMISRYSQPK